MCPAPVKARVTSALEVRFAPLVRGTEEPEGEGAEVT